MVVRDLVVKAPGVWEFWHVLINVVDRCQLSLIFQVYVSL